MMSLNMLLWLKIKTACLPAKSLQSCPTLCNPMDYGPPGSSVRGILQQEYWSGLPYPPPGDLPDPGIEPTTPEAPAVQAVSSTTEPLGKLQGLEAIISKSEGAREDSLPRTPLHTAK